MMNYDFQDYGLWNISIMILLRIMEYINYDFIENYGIYQL